MVEINPFKLRDDAGNNRRVRTLRPVRFLKPDRSAATSVICCGVPNQRGERSSWHLSGAMGLYIFQHKK